VLPLSLWSWQETVKAVFSGKVQVVDVYPDVYIRAVNLNMPLPSVIAMTDYVAHKQNRPAFTRRNIYLRDGYKCQYCGKCFRTNDLSLDHVLPRSRGGKLVWENTVTSCRKCNGRKGNLLPTNLPSVGMRLMREPFVPSKYELAAEAAKLKPRKCHPTWAPFLQIDLSS
jgi:5-methylcytosine-specific restriction endonuclease McrA